MKGSSVQLLCTVLVLSVAGEVERTRENVWELKYERSKQLRGNVRTDSSKCDDSRWKHRREHRQQNSSHQRWWTQNGIDGENVFSRSTLCWTWERRAFCSVLSSLCYLTFSTASCINRPLCFFSRPQRAASLKERSVTPSHPGDRRSILDSNIPSVMDMLHISDSAFISLNCRLNICPEVKQWFTKRFSLLCCWILCKQW